MVWFGPSNRDFTFSLFSTSHLMILFIFVIMMITIFLNRNKLISVNYRKNEIGLAILLIGCEVANHYWMLHSGLWNVGRSLPLELCNIGLILCVLLLLTNNRTCFELLFFIAIFGAAQAIITPALTYGFPHFRFFHFFFTHMAIVWVSLYFMWGRGYKLTFHSVLKLLTFINLLLPIILIVNARNNGNYWFLRHKPDTPSLFDLLGPYPWYIFTLEGLLLSFSLIAWLMIKYGHQLRSRSHVSEME